MLKVSRDIAKTYRPGDMSNIRIPVYRTRRAPGIWIPPKPAGFELKPNPSRALPVGAVPAGYPGFDHPGYYCTTTSDVQSTRLPNRLVTGTPPCGEIEQRTWCTTTVGVHTELRDCRRPEEVRYIQPTLFNVFTRVFSRRHRAGGGGGGGWASRPPV